MRHYFVINGRDSRDFECFLAESNMLDSPEKDFNAVSVPGRNGDLLQDNGRFKNFTAELTVYFQKEVVKNAQALKEWLLSEKGYVRYEESTNPEIFRMVKMSSAFEMGSFDRVGGTAELKFTCKPQKWMKTGEEELEIQSETELRNPTLYQAKPLIRVEGAGTLTIGNRGITCKKSMTIDCETMDCYDGAINENGNVTINGEDFPQLEPGENAISFTGFTRVTIRPNWWTV